MLSRLAPVALILLLAACATPQSLKPGTSIADARAALGRPTAEIQLPAGGSRLQYSGQPNVQSVWNADFDAQGRLQSVRQMMSDEAFRQISAGKASQDDVLREFGPPAYVWQFRLQDETAFMYRYYTYGRFPAAMYVYFDPAGVVKRTETGMDPWLIQDGGGDRN
jgi:hypothetical protein